jgi:hypothetical protein
MSPSFKNPHPPEDVPRSVWSTTGILIALGVLTVLMGLLMYGAIQGVSGGNPGDRPSPAIRATR